MNRLFTSYKYELKKLLVVRKGWIILVGIILVQFGIALFAKPSQEYVFDKGLYAEYVEIYSGEYSEETAAKIGAELESADKTANETDISQLTDAEEIEKLSNQMILASMKRNALSALQSKYAELSECMEYHPVLIYDLEQKEYINKFGINWASLIGMLFIISMLMLGDKKCGLEQIIFPTVTGQKNIILSKLLIGITLGVCLTAVCSAIQVLIMGIRWDFGSMNIPIQSISGFEKCTIKASVQTCMIVCSLIQVLASVVFVLIISILSMLLKKEPAVISAAVILILISAFFAEKFPSVSMLFLFSTISGINAINTYSSTDLLFLPLILLLKAVILIITSIFLAGRKISL